MNRSELVQAVARKQHLRPELADEVLGNFLDMIALCLSVDEDVTLRGFGRFKTRVMPGVRGLSNPKTGAKHDVPERRIAAFVCSNGLKAQLNGDEEVLNEAMRSLAELTTPTPKRARKLHDDALHRYLWNRTDRRGRVAVRINELSDMLGVAYETANSAIVRMRNVGRIRHVGYNNDASKTYEVADPTRWSPDDVNTHARRPVEPLWG